LREFRRPWRRFSRSRRATRAEITSLGAAASLGGTLAADTEKYDQAAQQISEVSRFTTEEVLGSIQKMIRDGLTGAQAIASLKDVMNLARDTNMGFAETSDVVATAMLSLKSSSKEVTDQLDLLALKYHLADPSRLVRGYGAVAAIAENLTLSVRRTCDLKRRRNMPERQDVKIWRL
jgi:minor tail protein